MINQLSSFMCLSVDGSDRISFTYNEVDESGDIISQNNKRSFVVVDDALAKHITAIRKFIKENKLEG